MEDNLELQITNGNGFKLYDNGIKSDDRLVISIVSPVYKNDPSMLLQRLFDELLNSENKALYEIVIVDDGSSDAELSLIIQKFIAKFPIPAKFYEFAKNGGRSFARNQLINNSIGKYILFLDSDMYPDNDNFLCKWLDATRNTNPTIAYGGYTTKYAPSEKKYDLARALASKTDFMNAIERRYRGALAVATSNLLVRRDIMEAVPFDCGFVGWGWEDIDWALRAYEAQYAVVHTDIPATHMGLDEAPIILEKLQKAGPNFKHILERHPSMRDLDTTKLAIIISKLPLLDQFAKISKNIAVNENVPIKIRSLFTRLWRAIWAAKAIS